MGHTIWQGLLIGILVSAPMGPIGVLCIQRTLSEGRNHGFATGVGAMLSDMVYALIAALGMGFIVDFIETNINPIQIFGSLILLVFGAVIFRSNPASSLQKQDEKNSPYWRNVLSSFLLNLSNIGLFFYFLAVFARFNFIVSGKTDQMLVGMISICAGILLWWFILSYGIDKVRGKFNPRALKLFNNILGCILFIIGIFGLATGIYSWGLIWISH